MSKEIPQYEIPENIRIGLQQTDEEGIKAYLEANALGFGGVQDAEGEFRFRVCGPDTKVYTAKDKGKVVSSVMTWSISEERSATENIFTIPEYRKKNIARATIARGLNDLKKDGFKIATLTCVGDNTPAIAMYISMGFELKYMLIEMHY